jgi:membrane protein required for colicin V production
MLTAFDVVVLLLIVLFAVLGAARGLVQEVLTLAAWIAGALALRFFYADAAPLAQRLTGTETGGAVLAAALLFIAAFAAVRMVADRLGSASRASVVGPVDRFLGFGFGALKGLIIASLLFLGLSLSMDALWGDAPERPRWLSESRTLPLVRVAAAAMIDAVDGEGGEDAGAYAERARDALGDLVEDAARKAGEPGDAPSPEQGPAR